jgi:hypothetical protein
MNTCGWILLGIMVLGVTPAPAQVKADALVTVADVTRITKISGVRSVPQDPTTGASGDVNFADAKGEMLLSLMLQHPAMFQAAKKNAAAPVAGVGDEAYEYPNAATAGGLAPYMLIFRKGPQGVMLTSFFDSSGKPRVPQAQLKELAVVIVGKLGAG